MTIEEELTLSYYQEVSELNKEHGVTLVKNILTNRLYVKKTLSVYNAEVYRFLMRHPVDNTPRIYAAAEDDGRLIVIEEYISGASLREVLAQGPLSETEALEITTQLCDIVAELHACVPPIIHRDIKPGNILLTDDGTVKLLDMNAAKQYLGEAEQDTQLIGTAGYAAPEQYGFGSSTVQTDIYAIGVLMATLTRGSFSRRELTRSPYDRIIEKCTRIDPGERYPSVKHLARALEKLRSGSGDAAKRRYVRWLPPGFRTLKLWRMLPSGLAYLFLLLVGSGLTVENPVSQAEIVLNRAAFLLSCLAAVFFFGNYLDVWDLVGITKIRIKWLRRAAAAVGAAVSFLLVVFLWTIAESYLR